MNDVYSVAKVLALAGVVYVVDSGKPCCCWLHLVSRPAFSPGQVPVRHTLQSACHWQCGSTPSHPLIRPLLQVTQPPGPLAPTRVRPPGAPPTAGLRGWGPLPSTPLLPAAAAVVAALAALLRCGGAAAAAAAASTALGRSLATCATAATPSRCALSSHGTTTLSHRPLVHVALTLLRPAVCLLC
jgi:hypothetical protein